MSKQFTVDAMETATNNLATANAILADLDGGRKSCLTITGYGEYVLVDDGSDRWIASEADFQESLDTVINAALDGVYDADDEGKKEAYDDLCYECDALYSRIGTGKYNRDLPGLRDLLADCCDEDEIADLFREICEEVPEYVYVVFDASGEYIASEADAFSACRRTTDRVVAR